MCIPTTVYSLVLWSPRFISNLSHFLFPKYVLMCIFCSTGARRIQLSIQAVPRRDGIYPEKCAAPPPSRPQAEERQPVGKSCRTESATSTHSSLATHWWKTTGKHLCKRFKTKNCCYSFLSSSEKNLNDSMFRTGWVLLRATQERITKVLFRTNTSSCLN